MHREILDAQQTALLPTMALFKLEYYLVGGTAIALDATEQVDYMIPHPPTDETIRQTLTEFAVQGL
ncbi:MAG: hypothetical protein II967_06630 [Deltaproteobacteria bacterium]|nr:hypothetical protein [Deltaproteobacteria bacterium]